MGGDALVTLTAVEAASLDEASARAEAVRSAAHVRAEQIIDAARAEAAALIARRRTAAERLVALEEQEMLADARAQAQALVLRTRRSVLTEAGAAAQEAGRQLVGDPRYARLLGRLAAEARARLAGNGPVEFIPATGGGFMARVGNRQLDYSLDALLGRWLESMGAQLEQLWR